MDLNVDNAEIKQNKKWGILAKMEVLGRNPSFPGTTKRRITTNLKSINNQKCQRIKLHGTPTTKELKKKSARTTRQVRWQTSLPTQKNCGEAADLVGGAG